MAGRPKLPEDQRRIREAIYVEPYVLEWLKAKALKHKTTTGGVVSLMVDEKIKKEKEKDRT